MFASVDATTVITGGAATTGAISTTEDLLKGETQLVGGAQQDATVYRVFGGDARAEGFSWTSENPTSVSNFRDAAGLPSGGASGATNTADFVLEGRVNPSNIIESRAALPLDGNAGGLPEHIIDPKNVTITGFKVLKP